MSVFDTDSLQYHVVCRNRAAEILPMDEDAGQAAAVPVGTTIKIKLEAMVLMDDGDVLYKCAETEGVDELMLTMDHVVEGEEGVIINVRRTFMFRDGGSWVELDNRSCYLPGVLGFDIPMGTDARFPDMRYNYDGRVEASGGED